MAANLKSARTAGGRREKPTVLVVCEGETERNYFQGIKEKFRARWILPKVSDRPDPLGVVQYADRAAVHLKAKGLQVETWVVFDAESTSQELPKHYREAVQRALRSNMHVANSSPCFEYWPLLHYAPGINVIDPQEAVAELRKPNRIPEYEKPHLPLERLWSLYLSGNPSRAAARRRADADALGEDPRFARPVTYVDELVDHLSALWQQR